MYILSSIPARSLFASLKGTYPDIPDQLNSRILFAAIIRKQIVIGLDHCDYYQYAYDQRDLCYYSFEGYKWTRIYPRKPGYAY